MCPARETQKQKLFGFFLQAYQMCSGIIQFIVTIILSAELRNRQLLRRQKDFISSVCFLAGELTEARMQSITIYKNLKSRIWIRNKTMTCFGNLQKKEQVLNIASRHTLL